MILMKYGLRMTVAGQIRVSWLICCQTSCLLCHLAVNCSLIVHQGSLSSFTCTVVTWPKGVFSFSPLNIWNTTQYLDNGHYPVVEILLGRLNCILIVIHSGCFTAWRYCIWMSFCLQRHAPSTFHNLKTYKPLIFHLS